MIWEEKKMKKFLAVLLTLVMVLCLAACGQTQEPAPVEPAPVEPAPAEPAEVGFTLNLKNKTGVTITGLYLYESGAADKGHSLCKSEWLTKDESDEYEYNAFLYRDLTKTFDLYVTFADGTDATWPGLTLANYDKLSLKDGVDPAAWEQEPVDDAEDIALMDEIAAAGRTADGYYPGYKTIGLEFKNKNEEGLNVTGLYFYEDGAEANYPNVLEVRADEFDGGVWAPGKGGQYLYGYFVRPEADTYFCKVTFDDGSDLVVDVTEVTGVDSDGNPIDEISFKSAVDPDLTKIQWDDDAEVALLINDAVVSDMPFDGFLPTVG